MRPPAFRFYVDNFVEGTADMTDAEAGLYVRLLCAQWSRGFLPNDDAELLRFSRGSTGVQPQVLDLTRIKKKFQVGNDGNLRNPRLEIEREKAKKFSKLQSLKGLASGKKRQPGFNRGSTPVEPSVSVSYSLERGSAVERPSLKEVLAKAEILGLATWKAEDWFHEMQGCGWLDHAHRVIVDWGEVLIRVRKKWEADGRPPSPPAARNGAAGPVKVFPEVQLKEIERQIAEHPCNSESLSRVRNPTELQRASYTALKAKRDALRKTIAEAPSK